MSGDTAKRAYREMEICWNRLRESAYEYNSTFDLKCNPINTTFVRDVMDALKVLSD